MGILYFDSRPLFLFGTAAICGVYMSTGDNIFWAAAILLFALAGAYIYKTNVKFIIAALLLFGVFAAYGAIAEKSYDNAYREYDDKKCVIYATVFSVDVIKEKYTLLTVRPKGLFKKKIKAYLFENTIIFMQGDKIILEGVIEKPSGRSNPGGYDARKQMYADGAAASISVQAGKVNILEGFTFGRIFGLIRRDIAKTCKKLLGNEKGGILTGMLIGAKEGLDPGIKENFKNSGLAHTMAVSGSHVAYLLAPLMYIFSKAGLERKKYYPWLMAFLLFFALLTGLSPSVVRASLTAGAMLAAGVITRETEPLNSLAFSALVLIAINPFAIFDAGFILSYTCVLSILVFYKPISGILGKSLFAKMLGMTLAVQIGILPALAKLFYTIQVFSLIANIAIFPIRAVLTISGWVMYLTDKIVTSAAVIIAYPVGIMTEAVSIVAEIFANTSLSVVNTPYIPVWTVVIYYAVMYLLLYKSRYVIYSSISAVIILCIYFGFFSCPRNTYIFFDSGQADCFLVKTDKGNDILIDTGEYALSNSIAYFCGDYIDSIFLSHSHSDHIGGLSNILDRFRVGMVFIPGGEHAEMQSVVELCRQHGVECRELYAGDELKADGYSILVMNPVNKYYLSLNDTSMVLRLTYKDKTLLFCGDTEIEAEKDILKRGWDIKTDIFKVPHHGAANGALKEFFSAAAPMISIISVGDNNFGHPSDETLAKLGRCTVYRTDIDGAVIIELKKEGYRIKTVKK